MVKVNTAVILAGGRGLRLMPETAERPKAMVKVLDRHLIEWIILWLKENNVKNIVVSVDYKKEVLKEYLGNGRKLGVKITYNDHSGSKDTGDAFRSILDNVSLPEVFLAMNGDQIVDLSIASLIAHHFKYDPVATIVTCPVRSPYGILTLEKNFMITDFLEKPLLNDKLMNSGIYVFNKKILKHLPKHGSIESTAFKKLARNGLLRAYVHNGLFTTVNSHKDLKDSEQILSRFNKFKKL